MTEHGTVITERFATSEHGCMICNLKLDSSFYHELTSQVHSSMLTMSEKISGFYVINRRNWDFIGFPFFIFLTDIFFFKKRKSQSKISLGYIELDLALLPHG